MWVLGLSYFSILATTFSPCTIGLKSPLGPPNMYDQDSITRDHINILLNNTLGALDMLLLHLGGTGKIMKGTIWIHQARCYKIQRLRQ